MNDPALECAAHVMDTFSMVMRAIGTEMHRRGPSDLSVQQFRALMIVKHHEGASVSMVSHHLGSTISSTSKLVDGLVERHYLSREAAPDDRRQLILKLTESGADALEAVHREKLSYLRDILATLSPGECATVMLAMNLLRSALT